MVNEHFLSKNLEKFIPNVLLDTSPDFIEFFKVYLDFLQSIQNMDVLRRIDVDHLDDDFLENLKWEYARDIPLSNPTRTLTSAETRQLLRDIINLNKNKGTVNSIEFLFRVLFHSTLEVEFGRYGDYLEYKPLDFEIEMIDGDTGEVITGVTYNLFSFQPFYVSNDQSRTGFCVTYFRDYDTDTNHLWCLTQGTVRDGDVLFFYNSNTFGRVKTTNKLQLDGWYNKTERWKDKHDFYVIDEINPRIDEVFFNEIQGLDKITVQDVIENNEDFNFYFSYLTGRLEIIQTDEVTGTSVFTRAISGEKDGETYTAVVQFSVTPSGISDIFVNGINRTFEFASNNGKLTVGADQFIGSTGEPFITKEELLNVRDLIAAFSIFFKTDIRPDHYMEIIRKNVVPAGYRLIHISFFISELLGNLASLVKQPDYKIKYEDPRSKCVLPPVTIDDIKYGDEWFDAFYKIDDLGNAQLGNWEPNTRQYYEECTYSLSTHATRVVVKGFSTLPILRTPSYLEFMNTIGSTEQDPQGSMLTLSDFYDVKLDPTKVKNNREPLLFVVSPQSDLVFGS